MNYRARVEAAILSGTPVLSALWWAATAGRKIRTADTLAVVQPQPLSQ